MEFNVEPLKADIFPLFFINAVNLSQRQRDLKRAQLRITYMI